MCEKPLPIQADFILRRLYEMAEADPQLRARQPWKAAYERDYGWLGAVLAEHYAGDDTNVRTLLAGVLVAHSVISVDDFEAPGRFVPTHGAASDARPWVSPVRIRADGRAARLPGGERCIWSRIGRRPLLAAGSSNGDIPMLDFARAEGKPFLRLLVLHDDAARKFEYTSGAEQALERARTSG